MPSCLAVSCRSTRQAFCMRQMARNARNNGRTRQRGWKQRKKRLQSRSKSAKRTKNREEWLEWLRERNEESQKDKDARLSHEKASGWGQGLTAQALDGTEFPYEEQEMGRLDGANTAKKTTYQRTRSEAKRENLAPLPKLFAAHVWRGPGLWTVF